MNKSEIAFSITSQSIEGLEYRFKERNLKEQPAQNASVSEQNLALAKQIVEFYNYVFDNIKIDSEREKQ
ncbi:hypothetical protein AGMMS49975_25880 [Clostridia bacterium]|nr:hypothetical protein AGMMS49975_25880 [Clostridia bacterium]